MKKSRFTEEQIIGFLKQAEAGNSSQTTRCLSSVIACGVPRWSPWIAKCWMLCGLFDSLSLA